MTPKHLRVSAGIKQSYVAHVLGMTQASVSKLERGELGMAIDKIPILAQLYEKTIEEIVMVFCNLSGGGK